MLLRDDKSFPYIVVTGDTRAPALYKHRGARSRKGDYFGPFASAGAVGRTINSLQRAFLLRTCTDSVFETRTRPCLLYQIKRCSAPCTNEVSDADYAELVSEAKDFLSGKSQAVKATIASAMAEASENLDFERAALYRDRLAALSHVQSHQGINPAGVEEADVFAIHHEGGISCIQVFFFRTGQNWGNAPIFRKPILRFPLPRCSARFLRSSMTTSPVRGRSCSAPPSRNRNCLHRRSARNPATRSRSSCRSAERRRISSSMRSQTPARRMAASSPKRLRRGACSKALPQPSNSLTCRAASRSTTTRISWAQCGGRHGRRRPGGFVKGQYRTFNIKSTDITPGDDFGMMREVMTRRFSRLLKEEGKPDRSAEPGEDAGFPAWPDVILIDGGQGQMTAVRTILKDLGVEDCVTAIGVAKGVDRDAGRERFFAEGRESFTLPPRDPVLYFIQRLRDEAHRFAIGSHRARRKKEMVKNPLDEIAGIGPTRKRALLTHFGTAKAVSRAGINDLMSVNGISETVARIVYEHFQRTPPNDGAARFSLRSGEIRQI